MLFKVHLIYLLLFVSFFQYIWSLVLASIIYFYHVIVHVITVISFYFTLLDFSFINRLSHIDRWRDLFITNFMTFFS